MPHEHAEPHAGGLMMLIVQHERDFHADSIGLGPIVLDDDFLVFDPHALNILERRTGPPDPLTDGFFKALSGFGRDFGHSGNRHGFTST